MRLNNIRADKRLKNRFNVSGVFAGTHGSAHIALKVCISCVLVGIHKRAKKLIVAIMLHFIFKHKRTNIGAQLQKFGFMIHIHIVKCANSVLILAIQRHRKCTWTRKRIVNRLTFARAYPKTRNALMRKLARICLELLLLRRSTFNKAVKRTYKFMNAALHNVRGAACKCARKRHTRSQRYLACFCKKLHVLQQLELVDVRKCIDVLDNIRKKCIVVVNYRMRVVAHVKT